MVFAKKKSFGKLNDCAANDCLNAVVKGRLVAAFKVVWLWVCKYACIYVCMNVCMNVCRNECIVFRHFIAVVNNVLLFLLANTNHMVRSFFLFCLGGWYLLLFLFSFIICTTIHPYIHTCIWLYLSFVFFYYFDSCCFCWL